MAIASGTWGAARLDPGSCQRICGSLTRSRTSSGCSSMRRSGRWCSAWIEKSQIQGLDRTGPILSMLPGVPDRASHDYKRQGTSSLFAALDVATGQLISRRIPHRAIVFKKFLQTIGSETAEHRARPCLGCRLWRHQDPGDQTPTALGDPRSPDALRPTNQACRRRGWLPVNSYFSTRSSFTMWRPRLAIHLLLLCFAMSRGAARLIPERDRRFPTTIRQSSSRRRSRLTPGPSPAVTKAPRRSHPDEAMEKLGLAIPIP